MDGGTTSAVQRLRQRFEVLDGLARASPAGPLRSAAPADSADGGRPVQLSATPTAPSLRRCGRIFTPAAAAAAAAGTGVAGLAAAAAADGGPKAAPTRANSTCADNGDQVRGPVAARTPPGGRKAPAVTAKSSPAVNARRPTKTEAAPAPDAATNGSLARGASPGPSQPCNGAAHADPLSPGGDSGLASSPEPPTVDAPPRPPKPVTDAEDDEAEPGDYLVPDGVPPVPPREPLSPEWGPARSPLVRRSLPPPPASLDQQAWFHAVDRAGARALVLRRGNGAFVVRPSQRGGAAAPFALTLLHGGQVYNFNVRQRSDGRFALGYHKKDEASFRSVEELVRHHQREPISLPSRARTCLTWYPTSGSSSP